VIGDKLTKKSNLVNTNGYLTKSHQYYSDTYWYNIT